MYIPAWPSLDPAYFIERKMRRALPFPLNSSESTYFYLARNGIYHLFRSLGFGNGGTVLVPDYHHGNEVYAIRAAGASIKYYPVRHDLSLDLDVVSQMCKERPRALYVTHFMGWPQPLNELRALCCDKGILLIEDCALSFLSSYGGSPLGS